MCGEEKENGATDDSVTPHEVSPRDQRSLIESHL